MSKLWSHICVKITNATGKVFALEKQQSIGGGCINNAFHISSKSQSYFVKTNIAEKIAMFAAESAGLNAINETNSIRAPKPICFGSYGDTSFLCLEFIKFTSNSSESSKLLGQQLAQMHLSTEHHFGWHIDNTIGSTPQINTQSHAWPSFWQQHRLGYQLSLAAQRGLSKSTLNKGEQLLQQVPNFYNDYTPSASLLHGDLWSGNYATDVSGKPVIYDPATYYGDRETDIAMTELFGGFSPSFYDSYQATYPLDRGYKTRKTLYNLYHILNHYNLFGSGYAAQADNMIDSLLDKT